jgi:glycosyltransferase involved in cell wall biosynthesis
MRIGYDGKRAVQNNTGLGNYSRYILELMAMLYPDNEYVVYAPKQKENPRLQTLLARGNVVWRFPHGLYNLFRPLWRTFGVCKELRQTDVYHGLSGELPVGVQKSGAKTVVTVHDLIFLRYPHYYRLIDRLIYRWKFRYACLTADKIIAISACTKQDIVRFFGVAADKIEVVYQGCHPLFAEPVNEEEMLTIAAKYNLPNKFILSVGTIEERKNLLLTVKALSLLPESVHLVAIGKSTAYEKTVLEFAAQHNLIGRLHIIHGATLEELRVFYHLAQVFVYPSRFEGFGIPVLEALTCGTPVIAATGSCLEEAGGRGSLYVHPDDHATLANNINNILDNNDLRNEMKHAAKQHAERFAPVKIAAEMNRIYTELTAKR